MIDSDGKEIDVRLFTYELWAQQMTDIIEVYLVIDGEEGTAKYLSIRSYADAILQGDYNKDVKELARSMLNYGGYAQEYFHYRTDEPANAGLFEGNTYDPVAELGNPNLSRHGYTLYRAEDTQGFNLYSAALALGENIYLIFYYTLDEGYTPEDYKFGLGGSVNSLTHGYDDNKGMYYVMVPGIAPYSLSNFIKLTVRPANGLDTLITLSYSPYSFLKAKLERNPNEGQSLIRLQKLCKAIYYYCEAARNNITVIVGSTGNKWNGFSAFCNDRKEPESLFQLAM